MDRSRALTAVTRFGLGPKPGEIDRVEKDPAGHVSAQCHEPEAALLNSPYLLSQRELRDLFVELHSAVRRTTRAARQQGAGAEAQAARMAARVARTEAVREITWNEVAARFEHGVATNHPFLERLVLFWSNHFAVNRRKGVPIRFVGGLFEREAIRPFVTGFFADMLAAATTHPAMLLYLDNDRSIGPDSRVGRRRGTPSVNENLAREVLELHTLGAGGGYTQKDVEALAHTLTGWTGGFLARDRNPVFETRFHDYGPRTILGKRYTVEGPRQLHAVLEDLAAQPATARHVCGKLARHFVADDVPDALVGSLADTFLTTGGDLRAVTLQLVESDVAWRMPPAKTVPPYDFMLASARAVGARALPTRFVFRSARDMAHEIWAPPSPAGWPDTDDAFLGGDALLERVDFARQMAERFSAVKSVPDRARDLFGAHLDPFVAEAVDRAESRTQAIVLLLMSPAFQRR